MKDFEVFTLTEFSDFNIQEYASQLLNENEVGDFLELVNHKNIRYWLRSPFCLYHFIEFYKKDSNDIPTTRVQLIERIFKLKINEDFAKYRIDDFEMSSYQKLLDRLAFAMNLLGRNSLTLIELSELFIKEEFEKLKQFSVVEIKNKAISFEHNVLQEYLAAKVLTSLTWTELLSSITFPPDFQKIKPKWFNTIGILLEIVPTSDPLFEPLLNLIVEKESNILANIEYKFFPLSLRLNSFKKIIFAPERKHKKWEIYGDSLIRFAGLNENPGVLEYLLDLLKGTDSFLKKEALHCLMGKDKHNLWGLENDVISTFCELLQTNEKGVIEEVIRIIINLELVDEKITEILVAKTKTKEEYWLIEDVVGYLNMSGELEKYLDIYINAIRLYDETLQARIGTYHFTGDNLYQGLGKIKSPDSLRIILDFLLKISVDLDARQSFLNWDHYNKEELFNVLVDNMILVFSKNEEMYKKILSLFLKLSTYNRNKISKCFLAFLMKSKERREVFWDIWNEYKNGEDIWKIDFNGFLDNQILEDCIQNFQNSKLSKKDLWYIINITRRSNYEWSEQLRINLNRISDDSFIYAESINWEEVRLNKTRMDFVLLLDRNIFTNHVINFFDSAGGDKLLKTDFDKINRKNEDNYIVRRFLREAVTNQVEGINKSSIIKWIYNNKVWDSYVIERLHNLLDSEVAFPIDSLEYVQLWCNENRKDLKFKTAVRELDGLKWEVNFLEALYANFFLKLEIYVPEETLLDMLSIIAFDSSFKNSKDNIEEKTFIEKIVTIIGFDKVKNRILENLQDESQPLIVTDVQVNWCTKFNCFEAVPFIKSILEKKISKRSYYLEYIYSKII